MRTLLSMRVITIFALTLIGSGLAAAAPMLGRSVSVYQSAFCRIQECSLSVRGQVVRDGDRVEQRAYRLRGGIYLVSTRAAPLIKSTAKLGAVQSVTLQSTYAKAATLENALVSFAQAASSGSQAGFDFDFKTKCMSGDVVNAYPFQIGQRTFTLQCNRFPLTKLLSVTIYQPKLTAAQPGTVWWNQFYNLLPAYCASNTARAELGCPLF
jgi:hypothetical protein